MEEKNAVLAALKALGDKIIALEEERDTQKLYREIAENTVKTLQAENEKLNHTVEDVHSYVARMEEK